MPPNRGIRHPYAVSGSAFGAAVSGPCHFVSRRGVARDGGDGFARSAETGSWWGTRG